MKSETEINQMIAFDVDHKRNAALSCCDALMRNNAVDSRVYLSEYILCVGRIQSMQEILG